MLYSFFKQRHSELDSRLAHGVQGHRQNPRHGSIAEDRRSIKREIRIHVTNPHKRHAPPRQLARAHIRDWARPHLLFPFHLGLKISHLHPRPSAPYKPPWVLFSLLPLSGLLSKSPNLGFSSPLWHRQKPPFSGYRIPTFKCTLSTFSVNPPLSDRKPYHGDGPTQPLFDLQFSLSASFFSWLLRTISCIIYSGLLFLSV